MPSEVRNTRDPAFTQDRICHLTLAELEQERLAMAGVAPPEADVAGELAALQAGEAKKLAALEGNLVIEVAQHPEVAMGHGTRKPRVREMELTLKGWYIGITTINPYWCCFQLLERLPEDMLRVWWWGNRTVDHRGAI